MKAFSLIEVLIFVTILGLFFVSASAVTTASLRNMKINEHKLLATKHADELLEWLKSKKEMEWDSFKGKINAINNVYCFNSTLEYDLSNFANGWPGESLKDSCSVGGIFTSLEPPIYDRQASLEWTDGSQTQIKVTIEVQWQDLGNTYKVPVYTIFAPWE